MDLQQQEFKNFTPSFLSLKPQYSRIYPEVRRLRKRTNDKKGKVFDVKVTQSVSEDIDAAIKLVEDMPK